MKEDSAKQGDSFTPPVSVFAGPIAELLAHRLLSPPTRPGLLASLGRYEVVRVLGGGGMGVVVLAHDAEKGRDVAIKLIRPELAAEQRIVHRFIKEAGHLQKLKHASIAPVIEISDRAEGPYFVMPYFEKGSLAARIRPGQPMDNSVALDIARQIADGLLFAHRHGIIHRDLKPANILLDTAGHACLADFGLARTMFNDTLIDVEREQLEGTAPYMSPGVAAGNAEDTRCDIYAFGALLYEMLTGEPPYAGRTTSEIRKQILEGPPRPIRTRNPDAAPALVAVAEGAMGRELRERYADMADVVADLDRIAAGKPVVGPRGASSAKRNPNFWVPIGIALIAAGLWLLWPPPPEKKTASAPLVTNPLPRVVPTSPITSTPAPPVVTNPPVAPVVSNPVPPARVGVAFNGLSVFAGQPGVAGSADGRDALFQSPRGIAVDKHGTVYVADTGNNTIRKITADGATSTLAGLAGQSGSLDGTGAAARFLAPMAIAVDDLGNVYVAEFANDTIREITPQGTVTTLAGAPGSPGSEDAAGDNAHFRNPWAIAVDSGRNLFVADRSNFTIRQVTADGLVVTLAGAALSQGNADGAGTRARFRDPHGIATDGAGNIYVIDTGNGVLRKITSAGLVTTLSGRTGSAGYTPGLGGPLFADEEAVTADSHGNLYLLAKTTLAKIAPSGLITTYPTSLLSDATGKRLHASALAVNDKGDIFLLNDGHAVWRQSALAILQQQLTPPVKSPN
jgi:serine/threonine protein kinase/sugar lactone lactonase YvrE